MSDALPTAAARCIAFAAVALVTTHRVETLAATMPADADAPTAAAALRALNEPTYSTPLLVEALGRGYGLNHDRAAALFEGKPDPGPVVRVDQAAAAPVSAAPTATPPTDRAAIAADWAAARAAVRESPAGDIAASWAAARATSQSADDAL